MRVGYQGDKGSNSEEAAIKFCDKFNLRDVVLVPLIDSKTVIGELKRGKIDYAVVAARNSIAGTVQETFEAIKDEYLQLVTTEILPIHHCLFKKPRVSVGQITTIASHIQALNQTSENRARYFSACKTEEVADTALAASMLASDRLPDNYAVLCRKNAGVMYNLELMYENLEDDPNNKTEFRVFKLPELNYENEHKPTLKEWFRYQFVSDEGIGYIAKIIMTLSILIAIMFTQSLEYTPFEAATAVGGYCATIFLVFTSSSFRINCRYKSLIGYWKYYSISDIHKEDNEQKLTTPRIVKVEEVDGELKFKGVICDKENVPFFETSKTLVSSLGKREGQLVYWYQTPKDSGSRGIINGIADLNWTSSYAAAHVNKMSGHYTGIASGDRGTLRYLRITEEEYNAHRQSTFL